MGNGNVLDHMLSEIVLESIGTAILAVDIEGAILTMNRAAEIMYAYPREIALGNSFLHGLAEHERPRFMKTHNFVVRTGKAFKSDDVELVNRAGETIFITAHSSLIIGPDGQKLGVVMLTENITEKKKMEKLVRRADKMAALGQLALGVSHQIRTPLGTIKALMEIIKADNGADEKTAKYFDIILDEVDRLDNLSRELMDFSGSTYLRLEEVDINAIMHKVKFLSMINRRRASIEFLLDLRPDLPPLAGDSEMLIHAFLNLSLNAMDAITENGFVRLATSREGDVLAVRVSDNGKGIAGDAMERIFNPFYTDKDNGTGLGLSIVQNIINEHGGHIDVFSRPGEGATFTVKLPLGGPGAGLRWKNRVS
ncbi:MAG: PAS domain S-box protein [Deltaproteobacteria bacterium]|jgi:two-component system sensor histidine kinase AtoS|nr:PAS domain S-box protein [Deltaproteobacteria bacterium]